MNGFVDVIATEPGGGRLIVDYKTDRLDGADPAEVLDRDYATQRIVYALAALRDGAPRVDVAYCFLERPGEPVVRSFTAADAGALAEQVVSLARGVLDERYEVTERPAPRALRRPAPAAGRCAPTPRSARWRRRWRALRGVARRSDVDGSGSGQRGAAIRACQRRPVPQAISRPARTRHAARPRTPG